MGRPARGGYILISLLYVCVFVCVYVPARAHFFMHSVACICLVINETLFLFLRKRKSWGRRGTMEPPHASKLTPSPSFFLRHDVGCLNGGAIGTMDEGGTVDEGGNE